MPWAIKAERYPLDLDAISRNMEAARRRAGISSVQLSEESGVAFGLIRYYERGRHYPTLYNLLRVVNALDISIEEYLFGGTTENGRAEKSESGSGGGGAQRGSSSPVPSRGL